MLDDSKQREAAMAEDQQVVRSYLRHYVAEGDSVLDAFDRIADALQRERDEAEREAIKACLDMPIEGHGCFTGDCPHTKWTQCVAAIQDELRRRRTEGE